jgi:uncharacterized protein YndB with AHSA1/START domain
MPPETRYTRSGNVHIAIATLPFNRRSICREVDSEWQSYQQRSHSSALPTVEAVMSEAIHQEVTIKATPERVYAALTDSGRFSQWTGAPATIEATLGGAFRCFGDMIEGRNVEMVPGRRLVQAWRAKSWPAGRYSIVSFSLEPERDGTKIVFDQSGFPEGERAHLDGGWHKMYWEPLQRYHRS